MHLTQTTAHCSIPASATPAHLTLQDTPTLQLQAKVILAQLAHKLEILNHRQHSIQGQLK
jgi:hypothetical protein